MLKGSIRIDFPGGSRPAFPENGIKVIRKIRNKNTGQKILNQLSGGTEDESS